MQTALKLYSLDVGLLGALSGLNVRVLLEGDALFREFKGSIAEQFVCQQLTMMNGHSLYCWSAENSSGELDFLFERNGKAVPVEVKEGTHRQAKSLVIMQKRHGYPLAYRFSADRYRDVGPIRDVPLYMAGIV